MCPGRAAAEGPGRAVHPLTVPPIAPATGFDVDNFRGRLTNQGMKKGIHQLLLGIAVGLLVSSAPRVQGDATTYWTFLNGFSPSTVVIGPGESVYWYNIDPYGFDVLLSVEGYQPYLLKNLTGVGASFDTPGVYGFSSEYGDHGSVIVNLAPQITITNPPNGATFPAPATFTIGAEALETPDDYVWPVEFFLGDGAGTNSIAVDYEAPFEAGVTNLAAGSYTLIAVATDSRGWTATNVVSITVGGATPLSLGAPRVAGNQFLFNVTGLVVGRTNVVQTSTNLRSWTSVKTNVAAAVAATVTNAVATGPHFYRVLQWP
jgi:plastocyanin